MFRYQSLISPRVYDNELFISQVEGPIWIEKDLLL